MRFHSISLHCILFPRMYLDGELMALRLRTKEISTYLSVAAAGNKKKTPKNDYS